MANFNDLELLKRISSWLQWGAIGLVLFLGVVQLGKWIIDRRINNIKDKSEKGYQEKINKLQATAQLNKSTIRTFESILKVKFNGNWVSKPYPEQILSPVNLYYYIDIQSTSNKSSIKFYATEPYQFNTIGERSAEFNSRQAVKIDDLPLGKSINYLEHFDKIQIHIPFIIYKEIKDSKITIEYIEITFIINGEKRYVLKQDCLFETRIIKHGNQGYANPGISLPKNALVDWLQPE